MDYCPQNGNDNMDLDRLYIGQKVNRSDMSVHVK